MENVAEAQLPGAPMLQISVKFFPSPSSPAAAAVRTDKIQAGHDAFVCELGDIAQERTGFDGTKLWRTVGPYYDWREAANSRQSLSGTYEDTAMLTRAGNSSQQTCPVRKCGGRDGNRSVHSWRRKNRRDSRKGHGARHGLELHTWVGDYAWGVKGCRIRKRWLATLCHGSGSAWGGRCTTCTPTLGVWW